MIATKLQDPNKVIWAKWIIEDVRFGTRLMFAAVHEESHKVTAISGDRWMEILEDEYLVQIPDDLKEKLG